MISKQKALGTNASDFIVSSLGTTTVAPGGSTTFTVTFAPGAAGARAAAIHIASNDTDENPFDITLTGISTAPEIAVEQPAGTNLTDGVASIGFGSVSLGGTSSAFTFTVKNLGTANLTSLVVLKDGSNASDFTVGSLGTTTVAPGGSTTFTITFAPGAAGARAAAIHIASNDTDENPFDITLTGRGGGDTIPGDLDIAFGTGGKVTTPIGTAGAEASSVAVQSDGRIVLAGSYATGTNSDFALVRYNANGTLDTGFGFGGKITTPIGTGEDRGQSVALQTDGKIVVAGYSVIGEYSDFAVVRYTANGFLDTGFGTGGKVTTPIGSSNEGANGVAMQSDGKIVVGGNSWNGSDWDFAVVRYNANGTLDTGFGTGGKVTTPFNGSDRCLEVAVQSDGKIVAAGWSSSAGPLEFALARYNANGTLDTDFGTGGKVTTSIGIGYDYGYSVTLQSDGKILVAGIATNSSYLETFALVRYSSDGTLDTSFGTGGKVTTPIGTARAGAFSVAVQSDGRIVLAGYSTTGTNSDFALVRYNANGTLDTGFGAGGKMTTPIGTGNDYGNSVALQTDGKIVVAGYFVNGNIYNFALVRYEGVAAVPEIAVEQPAGTNLTAGSASIGFGSINLGSTSSAFTFTVKNLGTASLTGLAITKDGSNSADFTVGSLGATTVAPGGSTTFTVTFAPGAAGARTAAIHIASNDTDENPFDITLAGISTAPEIAVEQPAGTNLTDGSASIGFGGINLGETSEAFTFTVKNTGTADLTGLAVTKNGTNAADYTVGSLGTTTLAAGASTTFTVTFAPGAAGSRTAAIHIASNDADDNPFDLNLTGTGVAVPEIAVEQPAGTKLTSDNASISFGDVTLGSASSAFTFTVKNLGTASLTGLAVTKDGANAADYTVGSLGATTLAAGASTTFTVTFAPGATGPRTAAIHIASNDTDENPFDINLAGTGLIALQSWRQTNFGSPDNIGDGADLNDFDGDGLPNLLEYAFGKNPKASDAAGIASNVVGNSLRISFPCDASCTDITYTVQSSATLAAGSWTDIARSFGGATTLPEGALSTVSDTGTGLRTVTVTETTAIGGKRFLRVKVTSP